LNKSYKWPADKFLLSILFFAFFVNSISAQKSQRAIASSYFPPAGNWETRAPGSMGLRPAAIDSVVAFAILNESRSPRILKNEQAATFGKEPFGDIFGPMPDRGGPTGIIVYKGYIIKSWGEPFRCDMTHSVTKSFLSTVVGLAVDNGMISNVNDKVGPYVPPVETINTNLVTATDPELLHLFSTDHNSTITWNDMLRQTSDWEGSLWGKPDWADRPDSSKADWKNRQRHKSGSVWEYNDVRVNALALAAASVWGKPLPEVLKEKIMDPIGASTTWRWTGYRNAWIVVDGKAVQSVSGGGHWGGGMLINAFDMARFGLLTLHKGKWKGKQLISQEWIKQALTPTPGKSGYGYMNWYLNLDKKLMPSAPATAFIHLGNGANIIYVDPENELVMVVRWIDSRKLDGLVKELLKAVKPK
jgi:hypothetical protein